MNREEKMKALEGALTQIEKAYGKGSIMKLGDSGGSRACSASINPAMPPLFCTSATIWSATVVLPLDSGPYTSMILPLGIPPSHMGLQARLMSQALRKLTGIISKSNCSVIFINQVRPGT